MITTSIYDSKKQELNFYISSLKKLDSLSNEQSELWTDLAKVLKQQPFKIDSFMIILKSNSYMMMYNMIESTIRELISTIYDAINTSSLRYDEVLDKIQDLWEKHQFLGLDDSNDTKSDSYKKEAHRCISFILKKQKIKFYTNNFKLSGNADFDTILSVTQNLGINFDTTTIGKYKNEIDTIKRNRNGLAHGSYSFIELGSDKTIDDLYQTSLHVETYLEQLKKDVNNYIKNKDFKKN
ncbi:MAE_28990/MAE_18760 family HEPN-like nuclease [uncultured Lactobacillus sp.]|uniref:MAE_28990/MAE_18760 family HEPN-like nuclease n=1 Tax=uncultured Lactobacillus sp. TaxID=153152 RepID=UPI0025D7B06B|nr:MAE_28990/MAE_18760 family HEPN-like nuclease [uncultured Lactobacillus sp.]